jgi:predicted ATPase
LTSEGNPLFVEELLATLVDREILQRDEGRWTTTQVPVIPLPSTIQALVSARIDRLPEPERLVLDLGSVEGKVFLRAVVVRLAADMNEDEVNACLVALVRKEFVRAHPGDAERFEFRHQLIRDAAYESMTLQVRADLHARLAGLLAQLGPAASEPGQLVDHHTDQARRYRLALGDRSN